MNYYRFELHKTQGGRKSLNWRSKNLVKAKSEIVRLAGVDPENIKSVWKQVE